MSYKNAKPILDWIFAFFAVILLLPLLVVIFVIASIDVSANGIFIQERIGQFGKPFALYKFQTINPKNRNISSIGKFLRKYKLDELPQLFNILKGEMSIVGPRPDIAGYYDVLTGEDREVLQLKPGLTSEASIKYRNEDEILEIQQNPLKFNDEVLFPDKVKMNLEYLKNISFSQDINVILQTIKSILA